MAKGGGQSGRFFTRFGVAIVSAGIVVIALYPYLWGPAAGGRQNFVRSVQHDIEAFFRNSFGNSSSAKSDKNEGEKARNGRAKLSEEPSAGDHLKYQPKKLDGTTEDDRKQLDRLINGM